MKHDINVKWLENMCFEAEVGDHKIIIDADEKVGGQNKGPRPKPLMLVALAGCTGMDVASLMRKMRIQFDEFSVKVDGKLNDEHPKKYTEIKVIYEIKGGNIPLDKVKKAVQLSEEKYCGVNAVYKEAIKMSSEIRINGMVGNN